MKTVILILLLIVPTSLLGQMMLSVEKPGTAKRYRYFVGEPVRVSAIGFPRPVEGVITHMTDTSLVISNSVMIMLDSITIFHKQRYLFSLITPVTWTAGAGYFLLDGFNRSINNQWPVITESTIKTTLILGGIGAAALPFHYSRYKIGKKWKIKILNLSDP